MTKKERKGNIMKMRREKVENRTNKWWKKEIKQEEANRRRIKEDESEDKVSSVWPTSEVFLPYQYPTSCDPSNADYISRL